MNRYTTPSIYDKYEIPELAVKKLKEWVKKCKIDVDKGKELAIPTYNMALLDLSRAEKKLAKMKIDDEIKIIRREVLLLEIRLSDCEKNLNEGNLITSDLYNKAVLDLYNANEKLIKLLEKAIEYQE